jgi:hypothetical protein
VVLSLWALGRWTEGRAHSAPILALVLAAAPLTTLALVGLTPAALAVAAVTLPAVLGAMLIQPLSDRGSAVPTSLQVP